MAAAVAMGVGSVVSVRNASGLSSSSAFGSPSLVRNPVAPLKSAAAAKRNVMITRAAVSEEHSGKTARREVLASLMAASALIATAGNSFAASGPGIPGAERTNEKANDLLKSADKLTKEDSPPRFGPGRVGGDDSDRIAQKGGAGAIESLQGTGREAVEKSKNAVDEAKARIDGIFGKKSTGDLSDASEVLNDPAGKVSSDVSNTKGQADSLVADAQSKFESASKDGKGVVGDLLDKIQDSIPK